jgi:hypothetical protein
MIDWSAWRGRRRALVWASGTWNRYSRSVDFRFVPAPGENDDRDGDDRHLLSER